MKKCHTSWPSVYRKKTKKKNGCDSNLNYFHFQWCKTNKSMFSSHIYLVCECKGMSLLIDKFRKKDRVAKWRHVLWGFIKLWIWFIWYRGRCHSFRITSTRTALVFLITRYRFVAIFERLRTLTYFETYKQRARLFQFNFRWQMPHCFDGRNQ